MEHQLDELSRPEIDDRYLRILLVEEDPGLRELVLSMLGEFGFGCQAAGDAAEALQILRDAAEHRSNDSTLEGGRLTPIGGRYASLTTEFGLVICDVRMPDRDGLSFLDQVLATYPDISVIMLASVDRSRVAVECLRRGASAYLAKPVDMDELIEAVEHALTHRRQMMGDKRYQAKLQRAVRAKTLDLRLANQKLRETYEETLNALAAALDAREQETANHSQRVAEGCRRLLRRLGAEEGDRLNVLRAGALLHDIGKIGIPDSILLKDGPLAAEEREIMKAHPSVGYEILRGIQFLEPALELVLYHQEKFDGSGYPYGLAGEAIPIEARAFAVVDAWDAMTNERPYRKPMASHQAAAELRECAGSHFDPAVVEAFLEMKREEGVLT